MRAVILDGIVTGLQYGLLGVGLTLVYGLGGVLNLAHGQIAVLGAIVTALQIDTGVPAVPAVLIGLLVAGAVALVLDLTLLVPVFRRTGEARVLLGLLLMLGVGFVIEGVVGWRYPIEALSLRIGSGPIDVLGVPMRSGALLGSALAIAAAVALLVSLRFTAFGKGVRSVIQDETGAQLCGISPATVRAVVLTTSGVLAALVAVTRSMTGPIDVHAGIGLTIDALIVAVVGGLGSVGGAFGAGLLLGLVNALSTKYIGQYVTTIVLLGAAAMTIVVRPTGLLGKGSE